jgi:predicted site-specific integrase-resolvase
MMSIAENMTLTEVADFLGCSYSTAYAAFRRGLLTPIPTRTGQLLFPVEQAERYAKNHLGKQGRPALRRKT